MNTNSLIYGIFLLCFGTKILALRCYQCNFCKDPFNPNDANIIYCVGMCEKSTYRGSVARTCYQGYKDDDCKTHRSLKNFGKNQMTTTDGSTCVCKTDLCNAASLPKPLVPLFAVLQLCGIVAGKLSLL